MSLLPSPLLSSLPALPISLLRAFHVYLLINLLLVVPLSSGLFSTLTTIFTEPASIPTLLGQSLVDTGGFFADYVALQGIVGVVSSALLRNVDWLGLIAGIWGWGKWSDRRKEGYLDNVGYVDVGSEMWVWRARSGSPCLQGALTHKPTGSSPSSLSRSASSISKSSPSSPPFARSIFFFRTLVTNLRTLFGIGRRTG